MKMQDALRYENGRTICGSNIIVEWAKGAPRAPGVCESNIQPFLECTRVICVSVKSCICHNSYQLSLAEWFWGWGRENENILVCFLSFGPSTMEMGKQCLPIVMSFLY